MIGRHGRDPFLRHLFHSGTGWATDACWWATDAGWWPKEAAPAKPVRGVPRGRSDVARAEMPRTSSFMTRTRCRHPGSTSSNEPKKAHRDCAVLGSGAKGARARARASTQSEGDWSARAASLYCVLRREPLSFVSTSRSSVDLDHLLPTLLDAISQQQALHDRGRVRADARCSACADRRTPGGSGAASRCRRAIETMRLLRCRGRVCRGVRAVMGPRPLYPACVLENRVHAGGIIVKTHD